MGKSKRSRVIALTKTKKKAKDHKLVVVDRIRKYVDTYQNIFVFDHENMTTAPFRALQAEFTQTKFCLGKNKVMRFALGKSEDDSYKALTYKLGEHLTGECGLIFTNQSPEEVSKFFEDFTLEEYAKAGSISSQTIVLPKGPEAFKKFSHSMEPYLRRLGLHTSLINTQIHLTSEYLLAQEGKELNAEQTKILKLLGIKLAEFKIQMSCVLGKKIGFKVLK